VFLLWILFPEIGIRFVNGPIYALPLDGEEEGVTKILLNTNLKNLKLSPPTDTIELWNTGKLGSV